MFVYGEREKKGLCLSVWLCCEGWCVVAAHAFPFLSTLAFIAMEQVGGEPTQEEEARGEDNAVWAGRDGDPQPQVVRGDGCRGEDGG